MCDNASYAILMVLVLLLIGAVFFAASRGPNKEGYLVYPYLDLDEPGERGSYYALSEGC